MLLRSILDTDLYKFSMQNFALKLFPNERVKYKLFIRKPRNFALFGDTTSQTFIRKLRQEIDQMSHIQLKTDEYYFLSKKCTYFDMIYLDFLKNYRYDPTEVVVDSLSQDGIMLEIKGYWHRTILWEVPLMAIISELFFQSIPLPDRSILKKINLEKAKNLFNNGLKFVDMGTRRRHSFENQQIVIEDFLSIPGIRSSFLGTSNPYFAMTYDLPVIGTKAHELYSLMAAIYGFIYANIITMEKWYEVYKGKLGIVLPDTFTTDVFLRSFTYKWAKLFDGSRQDSGNPIDFATKFIHHYNQLGIPHTSKTMLFSDSLNDKKAIDIQKQLTQMGRNTDINIYCIGTFFSNDIPGLEPLNMVIKLVARLYEKIEIPTIKLSDDCGKNTGDPSMLKICRDTFSAYRLR